MKMKINRAFLVSFSKNAVKINRVVNIGLDAAQKVRLGKSVYFGQPGNKSFKNTVKNMKNFNANSLISEDPFRENITNNLLEWDIIQTIMLGILSSQQATKLKKPDFRIIILEEVVVEDQQFRLHVIPIRRGSKVINKDWTWMLKGYWLQEIKNAGSSKAPLTVEFDTEPFVNLDFEIVATFDVKMQKIKEVTSVKSVVQYVFDVEGQQYAFKLHEVNRELARETLSKFANQPTKYTISTDQYQVKISNYQNLFQIIKDDVSIVNRLAKYQGDASHFDFKRISDANQKLDAADRIMIDESNKQIVVTQDCIGTFTALIHDLLLQRLITGDVELPLKNYH